MEGLFVEVNLSPELEAKLRRKAAEEGRNWFIREVEKGLAAADRGEFFEHEAVGRLIEAQFPG